MEKKELNLLDSLLDDVESLVYGDDATLDALRKRAKMLIRRICGETSEYIKDLNQINFHPMFFPASAGEKHEFWSRGKDRLINLIKTIKEEIELFEPASASGDKQQSLSHSVLSESIFVVHGHDEELKQTVARTIEKLGSEAIILHEKPNKGRTIIEKFNDYSKVSFAVVLLSADDIARPKNGNEESFRARQNVIFELGFFLGKLGRERVAVIYKAHEKFEMPSDYSGVLFIEYDRDGTWRYKLAKELKECGYKPKVESIL